MQGNSPSLFYLAEEALSRGILNQVLEGRIILISGSRDTHVP